MFQLQIPSVSAVQGSKCCLFPIPVAAWSKAWVYGRSLPGTAGSNPAGDIDLLSLMDIVCLSGSGICDRPIPRAKESYRVWCV